MSTDDSGPKNKKQRIKTEFSVIEGFVLVLCSLFLCPTRLLPL